MTALAIRRRARLREGLTLIEVMVALAILAGGLLAMLAMQIAAMRQGRMGRDHTEAATIAQAQMEILQRMAFTDPGVQPAPWNAPQARLGVATGGGGGGAQVQQTYNLQWRIQATADPNIRTVDVRVTWTEPNAPPAAPPKRYAMSSAKYNAP